MKRSLNILALLLALMMLLSACAGKTPNADGTQPSQDSDSQEATENNESNENDAPAQSEGNGQEQENAPQQEEPDTAPEQDSTHGQGNTQEQGSTQDQNEAQTPEDSNSYEEYLSALSLFALSMEYPDFQLQGIYAASSVALANKADSKGIYVFFDSMGESLCIRVTPMEAERTEAGTLDLFANEVGYAAFDLQANLPDTNGLTLLDSKVYGPLLSELNGVSLYNH